MSSTWFWLIRFSQRLIVRASLYALFAVAASLGAVWFAPYVPDEMADRLGGPAVESILSALAGSLLAVATFSVSAVIVAYTSISAQLTPRAARFITSDSANQRALATFIGTFLFSIVALVALGAQYYGPAGRSILFLATLVMVALVATTLLGWIDRVTRLGHHSHLLRQIEEAACKSLAARMEKPHLGGRKLTGEAEGRALARAKKTGYIANIDPSAVQDVAEKMGCALDVLVLPGDFVCAGDDLVRAPAEGSGEEETKKLERAFVIADRRTVDQDPGYGLTLMVEAAARAMSPGVNDPGTAMLAIDACHRLLERWVQGPETEPEVAHPGVRARGLDGCGMARASLGEIARHAASDPAVSARVQHALRALARKAGESAFADCLKTESRLALARAEAAISFEPDRERVREAARE